ncbi:MAG: putative RNA polymerase sigma factor FecI [Pseudomonas citronellolis]|nr:MAG: putative RNA polymerase sigma factor FecI [Pseudomonas citronellolis]
MSASSPAEAVQGLYIEHHRWLSGWLQRRLGCSQQAADLAQDTFLRLLVNRRPLAAEPLREPRHFLVTVAKRVMVDHFRRQNLERAFLDSLAQQEEAHELSLEERHLMLETLMALDAMLDGLGARAREAFLLSQLQGLKYTEIAARLGVSVSSVTKYVARATEACLLFALDAELA